MSVNIKQSNGSLKKIAGNTILLDGTCSEIQSGTITASNIGTINVGAAKAITITLPVAFPDANYAIIFPDSTNSALNVTSQNVTATGFEVVFRNILGTDFTPSMDCTWYAFRLVELEGYNTIYNKMTNIDAAPTENSTNLVTSGGVYDAISSASKIFINSESAWNELDAETKATYQVAIFTDKPNVNAVDSTDGSTTVVANKHLVFTGTLSEWDALSIAEKKAFDEALITNDMDTGEVVDAVTDGDMRAVTSNAVYDALNASITDLTADETAMTYEDYTVETLGAHMYQVGGLCWVHIDIRVTYTGEVALDTDGHKDFWSNKFSIPDFDDVSEWNAVPCFGYVSNSHRRFEITLNNFGVTGGQKAIAFRLRYGEDEPIYTGDVFNLRCVCCFAKA